MTDEWTLALPDGHCDDESDWWMNTQRDYLTTQLAHGDMRFDANFYGPTRITQYADMTSSLYEPNMIIVPEVTREAVHQGLARMARRLDWLLDLAPTPKSTWKLDGWGEDAALVYGDRRFPVALYDREQLAEAVGWDDPEDRHYEGTTARPVDFYAPNLFVLSELTREAAENVIAEYSTELNWLVGL
ncbi:hypothetical protein AB5J62_19450 [Amycolatopsis sp. cg5]|uniref:hypothetical protein n=1 Tax=Amycolatopsis sp. cg5 TaxID=3238802 RepID=UPI0035256FFF